MIAPQTAAERQRSHRARQRAARAREWQAVYPMAWAPFLAAWADRGLRLPPSEAQLQLLRPYVERPRGPGTLASVLARHRRARARHRRTTYGLVASIMRAMEQIAALSSRVRDAFDRPLSLHDPNARRERGEGEDTGRRKGPRNGPAPGQAQAETLLERLRRHGLAPGLGDELERRQSGKAF